ncbi:tRNA-guanine transglycosylase DpdA [Rhodospirillales bacterium]|nr:tRNA-guanine transglycosylase DpdA [Rhodospirillales bacterium]
MKFIYADSKDTVDPNYDFIQDRSVSGRDTRDDVYPHEILDHPPYDGVLLSKAVFSDRFSSGKYSESESFRFDRDGARKFLRLDNEQCAHLQIFGDCGAFNYANLDKPPYSVSEIVEFYDTGRFTHGCSLDHIIFEHDNKLKGMEAPKNIEVARDAINRFEITLENAEAFHKECKHITGPFTPIGVVQGWSPGSMAEAARRLVQIGYDYIALGGMVPLGHKTILEVVANVRESIQDHVRIHILGFGKIDDIGDYAAYNVTSIDTTSPLLRAFKDNRHNFFMPSTDKRMRYYTAVRVPQATVSKSLNDLRSKGLVSEKRALNEEKEALANIRAYGQRKLNLDEAILSIMKYTKTTLINPKTGAPAKDAKLIQHETAYRKILEDRPWEECDCAVCRDAGIEAAIFRASNRNKRRGIHNMSVFHEQLKRLTGTEMKNDRKAKVRSG